MNHGTFMVRPLVLSLIFSGLCASTLQADQPNVLLIMVDDLRDYGGDLSVFEIARWIEL